MKNIIFKVRWKTVTFGDCEMVEVPHIFSRLLILVIFSVTLYCVRCTVETELHLDQSTAGLVPRWFRVPT